MKKIINLGLTFVLGTLFVSSAYAFTPVYFNTSKVKPSVAHLAVEKGCRYDVVYNEYFKEYSVNYICNNFAPSNFNTQPNLNIDPALISIPVTVNNYTNTNSYSNYSSNLSNYNSNTYSNWPSWIWGGWTTPSWNLSSWYAPTWNSWSLPSYDFALYSPVVLYEPDYPYYETIYSFPYNNYSQSTWINNTDHSNYEDTNWSRNSSINDYSYDSWNNTYESNDYNSISW